MFYITRVPHLSAPLDIPRFLDLYNVIFPVFYIPRGLHSQDSIYSRSGVLTVSHISTVLHFPYAPDPILSKYYNPNGVNIRIPRDLIFPILPKPHITCVIFPGSYIPTVPYSQGSIIQWSGIPRAQGPIFPSIVLSIPSFVFSVLFIAHGLLLWLQQSLLNN